MKAKPRAQRTVAAEPPSKRSALLNKLAIRIAPELADQTLYPLIVLSLLKLVDEFDIAALGILGPNIRAAFHLTDAGLGWVRAAAGLVGLLIPFVGYMGDRLSRVKLTYIGAFAWGVFAFCTGLAPAILVLVLFRMGSGIGKLVSDSVHVPLLFDYYPPVARGRVFSFYRAADGWGLLLGPALAGLVAWQLGWRWAFFLLAIPTFVTAYFAMRLHDPVRGITDNSEAALEAAAEPPVPFDRAVRWLVSIPTLKRILFGAFCTGLGGVAYAVYSSVFLDRVFHIGELGRGLIATAGAPFLIFGLALGGRITDKLQRTKTMAHITMFFGFSVVGIGLMLLAYSVAPTLWAVIAISFLVNFSLGIWVPAYITIVGAVSPARIRSLGLSYAGFFFTLGIIGTGPIGSISDHAGVRWALAVSAIILALGGLVHASAAKFANADISRSLQVLQTEANLRYQRLHEGSRALLVVENLNVAYDDTQVLFGVNFDVQEGELVALLGTNGAGKSTLLKAISGLMHPMDGVVYFDGTDITHLEPEETAATGIILMPGGKSIFPTLTVKENIDMASWLYDKDKAYVAEAKRQAFDTFPILRERTEQLAGSLSGGEQQMLSLAQAFIAKPKLLMIDELSLGLAPLIVQQLLGIVEEIHQRGTTVVLVEQSVNVALTVAHHAYFMEKGEIRFNGSTSELLQRKDILRSVFLEGAKAVVSGNGKRK